VKSIIVYGTFTPELSISLNTAFTPSRRINFTRLNHAFFVRTELFNGDCSEALRNANPIKGETVMNTVEIPE